MIGRSGPAMFSTMTKPRVNMSLLLLLAITTVSVVCESTENLQEIRIDIIPNDASDSVWPHREATRQRRMRDDRDRQKIVDTVNRLRRSLGAPDMYYATWDRELERRAISLTSNCYLQSRAQMAVGAKYARGFTGYTRGPGVTGEIEKVYFKGANSSIYWQIMSSHLMYIGCAVSDRLCKSPLPHQPPLRVFTCLFAYSRPLSTGQPRTSSSPACSQCDNDALWCDAGLCRIACRPGDIGCVRNDRQDCETKCSSCSKAVSNSHCQCVCYYANGRRRCTGNAEYATRTRPICRAATKTGLQTPAGFLSLTVCVLLAFIILCVLMACCISRCRTRKRRQRQSSSAAARSGHAQLDDGSAAATDLAASSSSTSAFVISPPILLTPPPYVDVAGTDARPPPYHTCLSYQSSVVCNVADLPSAMCLEPTAPPRTASNSQPRRSSGDRHHPDVSETTANRQ